MRYMFASFRIIFFVSSLCLFTTPGYSGTEVDFEESTLALTPKVWISLPNGVVQIVASEKVGNSDTIFKIKYDFFDSNITTRFDFNLWFKTSFFGIEVGDIVDFDEIISNQTYTMRNRYIMPHYDYILSKNFRVRTMLRSEDRYFARISPDLFIEKGTDIRYGFNFILDSLIDTPEISRGIRASLELTGPASFLGSDYDYVQAEFNSRKVWRIFSDKKITFDLKSGYPITSIKRPLEPMYHAGGYAILRGYDYKDFSGNSIIYGILSYNVPFRKNIRESRSGSGMDVAIGDLCFEFAKLGDTEILTSMDNFKASVYVGARFKFTLFKRLNMKISLMLAQAIEPRPAKVILNIDEISYFVPMEPEEN